LSIFVLVTGLIPSPRTSAEASASSRANTSAVTFDENDPLLVEAKLQPLTWSAGQSGSLILNLKLPPGYHGYEDQIKLTILEPDGFKQGKIEMSSIKEWYDKFSKKKRRGFENASNVKIQLEAPVVFQNSHTQMKIDLTYQACTDSFCLFPTHRTLSIPIDMKGPFAQESALPAVSAPMVDPTSSSWLSVGHFEEWLGKSRAMALLFAFLAGILTSFTPCIFPMIPITLAILAQGSEQRTRAQNFLLSVFYVLGIAFTYSILGLAAASSGQLFGASLGNPWVLSMICGVFLLMSLSMYGYFELQVPAFVRNKLGSGTKKTGHLGAFISGLFAGVVASPCVGPILVGILAYVASQKDHVFGFFLLFTYALGLGLIFLVLGAFTELTRKLPRSGVWMDSVKFVLGSVMLGVFYYYLSFLIPERWHQGFLGVGLILVGSLAGAFSSPATTSAFMKVRKGFLQAILLIGIAHIAFAIFAGNPTASGPVAIESNRAKNWKNYSETEFKMAIESGKPIIIDFYADWCAACHELDQHTFSRSEVQEQTQNFVLFRFDATKDSPELQALKKKYKIQGLPTVVFHAPNGEWRESLTLTEFEKAESFLKRLDQALKP